MKEYNNMMFIAIILLVLIYLYQPIYEKFINHSYDKEEELNSKKMYAHPIRVGHTYGGSEAYNEISHNIKDDPKFNDSKFIVLNDFKPKVLNDEIETNKDIMNEHSISEIKHKFNHFPIQEKPPQTKKYSCIEKCIASNIECIELNCNNGSYKQCNNHSNLQNYVCHCKAKENCNLNKGLEGLCETKCSYM